jgi:hypothetical protein
MVQSGWSLEHVRSFIGHTDSAVEVAEVSLLR